jgi:hypothetical protein
LARVLKIFFHDACFDGTASAAIFSAFYRDVIDPHARVVVQGVQHRDGDPFTGVAIDGDDNACVDFRYSASPAMRWWFDHHRTAFQPASLRDAYERERSATKFFEPDAPSCAGLVVRTTSRAWSWRPPAFLDELARWADVIDAAAFASADEAVAVATPAQRLAVWVSHNRDPVAVARYVDVLSRSGLDIAARDPVIARRVDELIAGRDELTATLRRLARLAAAPGGEIVVLDLMGEPIASSPGFLGYQLYPGCSYVVSLVRGSSAIKISVGRNPWNPRAGNTDVGALCERLGGGGHATVGGVTLQLDEVARARDTVGAIVDALARPATSAGS